MKNIKNKAFTLVELLVVITILAIISVVAYQNFWGAVDKAVAWRKISDVSTIETWLQQYKSDKWYYPAVWIKGTWTWNLWWYNSWTTSTPSNKIQVTYNWEEINTINTANSIWGWKVYWTWAWASGWTQRQIWAKWTIWQEQLWKAFLSKDLYDPEISDIKVNSTLNTFIDYGLGRYVYATFKKNKAAWNWTSNKTWVAYNIAYTVRKKNSDKYITKIVWDYDKESCFDDKANCPDTLIWLTDWQEENWESNTDNYWVPYAVADFAQ